MKHFMTIIVALAFVNHIDASDTETINLDRPVQSQGTVSFTLHTNQTYANGGSEEEFTQVLFKLPGLASCILQRAYSGVFVAMQWDSAGAHSGFYLLFTELQGSEDYHIQFTWDAEKGISDGYFNGMPFRLENPDYYRPWTVKGAASQIIIKPGANQVTDVKAMPEHITATEARRRTPEKLKDKYAHYLGQADTKSMKVRKGSLLYAADMGSEAEMSDWIIEGPAIMDFVDDHMILRSEIPRPTEGSTGHFNIWCPGNFPEDIMVEWEFKPITHGTVTHLFFSAQGKNGENIFDDSIAPRDGHFRQYIDGDINNYYIIYFSNLARMRTSNMARTWLCKASTQTVLGLGDIAVKPGNKTWHKMRMIKKGARIQLQADGKVVLDAIDNDYERWGTVLKGGHLSFRQMARTMAAYRNFKVWALR